METLISVVAIIFIMIIAAFIESLTIVRFMPRVVIGSTGTTAIV